MPIHEIANIDPVTGETLGETASAPAMGISTAPEDRGEEVEEPQPIDEAAFEAMFAERMAAEKARLKASFVAAATGTPQPVEAPTKTAAEIDNEQIAATLAKVNAAAEAEIKAAEKVGPKEPDAAKVDAKVAEKVQEAEQRQAAMDAAKVNGAAPTPAPAAGKAAGRQVAKPKPAAVAPADEIDAELMAMIEADAGRGLNFKAEDLAIPRLYLLQDMSPQVKERSPDYVQGARPGMWFNTVTGQIMPSVTLITINHKRRYVAWRPRLDNGGGGGLVKPDVPYEEYMGYEETGISVRSYRDDKGLVEVVDTPELVGLLLPEAGSEYSPMPVAISFPKTKAKVIARMLTLATMQVSHRADGSEYATPFYMNVFRLSQKVEGEGAQSYFVPVEEYLGRVSRGDYIRRAKRLFEQFETGSVHVADVGAAEQ